MVPRVTAPGACGSNVTTAEWMSSVMKTPENQTVIGKWPFVSPTNCPLVWNARHNSAVEERTRSASGGHSASSHVSDEETTGHCVVRFQAGPASCVAR